MNMVILTGNMVKDAEVRSFDTGNGKKQVMSGKIAVQRPFKNAQGEYEADFFIFETWINEGSKLPENCLKGTLIEVQGQMRQDSIKHDDGTYENYSVKVVSAKIGLLRKPTKTNDDNSAAGYKTSTNTEAPKTPKAGTDENGVPWELDL